MGGTPGASGTQGRGAGGAPAQTPGGGWQAQPGHPPPGPDRRDSRDSRDHGRSFKYLSVGLLILLVVCNFQYLGASQTKV